jgi:uncharacterized protein (DUF2235 family)
MKRLVLCFDGTWNTEKSNTNVSRLFRKIAGSSNECSEQRQFYDEGVGTSWGERIRGGMLGMGLDRNIRQGFAWLAAQFREARPTPGGDAGFMSGPDIYLLGFSRGAFTARSLGGLINYLGLPNLGLEVSQEAGTAGEESSLVLEAWNLYAARPTKGDREDKSKEKEVAAHDLAVKEFRSRHYFPVQIHFLGVWDTVGALGIPRFLDYKWIPRPSNKFLFHNTRLGDCVRFAYHAMAIDEQREPYCVTLWTDLDESRTEDVEQRWFPGAHADVGGGYEDCLLPDPPLAWIAKKAAERGLHFVNDRGEVDIATGKVPPTIAKPPAAFDLDGQEYLSPVHDSYSEFAYGAYKLLRSLPGAGGRAYRRMLVLEDGVRQTVDATAYRKMDVDTGYRPPNLSQAGRVQVSYRIARLDSNT